MNIQKFIQNCNCPLNGAPYKDMLDPNNIVLINLLRRCLTMFHIENLPETINERVLMFSFWINESYGVLEYKGDLRNVWGGYAGKLDFYGYPTEYLWTTTTYSDTTSLKDMVVGHSNHLWFPFILILNYYAEMLSSFDTSLKIASVNTRACDLYKASTDAERERINNIFSDLEKGKINHAFLSEKDFGEMVNGDRGKVAPLGTQSANSQYIPMLLQGYDNVLARVCREIGINITNVMKRAQVINAEVNGYENYSQISLSDMQACMEEFCDNVNKKFGENWKPIINKAFMDDSPDKAMKEKEEVKEEVEEDE